MPATPEQIALAKEFMAKGADTKSAALRAGISPYAFKCALEPEYRQRCVELNRQYRIRRRQRKIQRFMRAKARYQHKTITNVSGNCVSSVSIPQSVEDERQRAAEFVHNDLTAQLLGDPPPWRSALARRL